MTPSAWPGQRRAALTLSFDDGFAATHEHTVDRLHARDLRATYNIISGRVGSTFEGLPTATWADWRRAGELGHEIASHGVSHRPLAGLFSDGLRLLQSVKAAPNRRRWLRMMVHRSRALSAWSPGPEEDAPAGLGDEIAQSRQQIKQELKGLEVSSFAYPTGRHNRTARRRVATAGYLSARGNSFGLNHRRGDPFRLRAIGLGPGLDLADLKPLSEWALAEGGWLILVLHLVSEQNNYNYPYWLSISDFSRLLDRLQPASFWIAGQAEVARYLWFRGDGGGAS